MRGPSDDQRIQKNVRDGFGSLVERMQSAVPPRPDVEEKIHAAFATWKKGEKALTTSLLLDALIKLYEERIVDDLPAPN
jgi:hypothetical protein